MTGAPASVPALLLLPLYCSRHRPHMLSPNSPAGTFPPQMLTKNSESSRGAQNCQGRKSLVKEGCLSWTPGPLSAHLLAHGPCGLTAAGPAAEAVVFMRTRGPRPHVLKESLSHAASRRAQGLWDRPAAAHGGAPCAQVECPSSRPTELRSKGGPHRRHSRC